MATEKTTKSKSGRKAPKKSHGKRRATKPVEVEARGAGRATESILYVFATLVVVALLNVAGHYFFHRFDFTANRLYSLSQASERLVANLDDDMEITAYFTADLPPPFNATELYVRNILAEYEAASGGRLHVRFVDPDDDDEREAAQQDGIQEVPHQLIENDSVSVQNGYRGLVVRYLGDRQTLPVIQDTRGLEYEITQAIRLLVREPTPVGVVQGHGSPTLAEGLTTIRGALRHYTLQEVDVSEEIDTNLKALLVVGPTEELTDAEQRRINEYVMHGGSLGVFGGSMNISIQGGPPSASTVDTGINTLLAGWGVEMGSSLVADARCGRVPMGGRIPIPVPYPPAPIVSFTEAQQEHPALFRIAQAPFFFVSPITTADRFAELHGTVLGQSSDEQSWLMTGDTIPLQPRDPREWRPSAERGPHTLMVALEGELPSAFSEAGDSGIDAPATSEEEVRLLVVGSASMLRDEFLPQGGQQGGAAMALALNSIDWLAGDADLIAIRAKNIEDPALEVPQSMTTARDEALEAAEGEDETEVAAAVERYNAAQETWDAKKRNVRWGITIGLPLFVLMFGFVRWRLRTNQRANLEELRKKLAQKKRRS